MEINKTLIIPLRNESKEVVGVLSRFEEFIKSDTEFLVVLDSQEDQTYKILDQSKLNVKILISEYPPGASNAIKYGVDKSNGKSICIAMGDGSDDPRQVEDLLLAQPDYGEQGLEIAEQLVRVGKVDIVVVINSVKYLSTVLFKSSDFTYFFNFLSWIVNIEFLTLS